jgi:hypothetical protein
MREWLYYQPMFSRMDIDKVLKNSRMVHAILGVSAREFATILTTFTQICREEAESKNASER